MAFHDSVVVSGITGGTGYASGVRDMDGRLYVALYDPTASPKATQLYYSDDNGVTEPWTVESWSATLGAPSASDGGDDPQLMVAPDNNIWLGVSKYDGSSIPTVLKRIGTESRWGGSTRFGEWTQFGSTDTGTSIKFAIDPFNLVAGFYNIVTLFVGTGGDAGKVMFLDFTGLSAQQVNSTTAADDCHIAVSSGGVKNAFWRETGTSDAWYSSKTGIGPGGWSTPTKVSTVGHTVTTIEDAQVKTTTDLPAVLYRANVAGTNQLFLSTYNGPTLGTWTVERVWDGVNNREHYAGCALSYDERGAVWVSAMYDYQGLGTAEHGIYKMIVPLGVSTWSLENLTGSSAGDAAHHTMLMDHNPSIGGAKPNVLHQGSVWWTFYWISGGVGNQVLYFIDHDTLSNPRSNYPTKYRVMSGEIPFRDEIPYTGTSVTIAGETAAATTFPLTNIVGEWSEETIWHTSVATFESGWTARVARYPSGRRIIDMNYGPATTTDKDTLRTFLIARQASGSQAPFAITPPEEGSTIDVYVTDQPISYTKIGAEVWRVSFQMEERL